MVYKLGISVVLFAAVFLVGCGADGAEPSGSQATGASSRITFWIGSKYNDVFDKGVTDFINTHAGLVILEARLSGKNPYYDYPEIVQRIHGGGYRPPVLMYTWGTRDYKSVRIGASVLSGYSGLGELIIPQTVVKKSKRKSHFMGYGDVRSSTYRKWIVSKISNMDRITGTDGVAMDMAVRTPFNQLLPLCAGTQFCQEYATGVDKLIASLHAALGDQLFIYNGLWSKTPDQLADQTKLLAYSDGASIEFFGRYQKQNKIPSFNDGVLQYLKVIRDHPNKTFLVFGRGSVKYQSYKADYLWQRYLYCAYLMVARDNTYFHYNSTFQIPSSGRAGALAWYRDWDISLGAPLAPYKVVKNLYKRQFQNALVLLVPRGEKHFEVVKLTGAWYTPEGVKVERRVKVMPGEGLLLSRTPPPSAWQPSLANLAPDPVGGASSPAPDSVGSGSAPVNSQSADKNQQQDLMLDREHALSAPGCFVIKVKTNDKQAKLVAIAAVDDKGKHHEKAAVVVSANGRGNLGNVELGPLINYRIVDDKRGSIPYTRYPLQLKPDGHWDRLNICGDTAFGKNASLSFQQWKFVRIYGAVKVDSVRLWVNASHG